MKLNSLKVLFPKTRSNSAVTGNIDIKHFTDNEEMFRKVMRENNLKAIYRGPRISNNLKWSSSVASMTRRCDATSVLLYHK